MKTQISRREFLASAAMAGAGMLHPAGRLLAQTAVAGNPSAASRIDVHHHIIPTPFLNRERDLILSAADPALGPRILAWRPAQAVEEMDRNGIATGITSISNPGIWRGNVPAARSLARECNEYAAQMVRDYPSGHGFSHAVTAVESYGFSR